MDLVARDTVPETDVITEIKNEVLVEESAFQQQIEATEAEIGICQKNMGIITDTAQYVKESIASKLTDLIKSIENTCTELTELVEFQEKEALNQLTSIDKQLREKCTDMRNGQHPPQTSLNSNDRSELLQEFQSLNVQGRNPDQRNSMLDLLVKFAALENVVSKLSKNIEGKLQLSVIKKRIQVRSVLKPNPTSSSPSETNPGVFQPSGIFGSSASASTASSRVAAAQTNTAERSSSVGSATRSTAPCSFGIQGSILSSVITGSSIGASAASNSTEQGVMKPTFNLFGNPSSSSTATNPGGSKPSSMFGSSSSASTAPFLFGQTNTTAGSTGVGSGSESTIPAPKPFLFGSQEIKPTPTASSTGAPPAPFSFGSAPSNISTTSSVFAFGAPATTSNSTGSSSSSAFGLGSNTSAAANPPPFGTSQAPVFGQNTSQPPAAFGSSAAPTFPFLAGCPPSAFSSQSTSNPPSLFGGQLPNQPPSFGSTSSTTSSNSFQFGNSGTGPGFNFNPINSSNEVFKFGSPSTGAPQQLGPTGNFPFNQAPAFSAGVVGTNPFSASSGVRSTVAGQKIKTAVRRKK